LTWFDYVVLITIVLVVLSLLYTLFILTKGRQYHTWLKITIPILMVGIAILTQVQWCHYLFVCDCYDEDNVIFNYQFMQNIGKGLWMGVEHTKCELMLGGGIDKCYRENYTYYFAADIQKFDNLTKGDKLITHWCYIPQIQEYRIRGLRIDRGDERASSHR
jgi:hypothetical protein